MVGTIDAPIGDVQIKALENGTIALGFSAEIDQEGNMINSETAKKPDSTAREYETARVRYWDKYWGPYRSTL